MIQWKDIVSSCLGRQLFIVWITWLKYKVGFLCWGNESEVCKFTSMLFIFINNNHKRSGLKIFLRKLYRSLWRKFTLLWLPLTISLIKFSLVEHSHRQLLDRSYQIERNILFLWYLEVQSYRIFVAIHQIHERFSILQLEVRFMCVYNSQCKFGWV